MRAVRAPLDPRSSPRPPSRFLAGMVATVLAGAACAAETQNGQDAALETSVDVFDRYCVPALVNDGGLRPDLDPAEHDPSQKRIVNAWWASPFSLLKELKTPNGYRGCQIEPVPTAASPERPSPGVLTELQHRFDEWADAQKTQSVFSDVPLCSEPPTAYQRVLETRVPNPDGNYVKVFMAVFDDPRNFFIVAAESGPTPHSCEEGR